MRAISTALAFVLSLGSLSPAPAAECATSTPAKQIGPAEANRLYDCIAAEMIASYSRAEDVPGVPEYRQWTFASSSPLVSATHGSMMVNHIANPVAAPLYLKWEGMRGQRFPVGSILAKESYRVTNTGEIQVGPLFLMEKAALATSPPTADWIYTRVFPDGRVQRTGGPDGSRMAFCHDFHAATQEDYDAMFFPPKAFRATVE